MSPSKFNNLVDNFYYNKFSTDFLNPHRLYRHFSTPKILRLGVVRIAIPTGCEKKTKNKRSAKSPRTVAGGSS